MQLWRKENKTSKDSNRINIVMAIIFLLGGGVLFKLFSLQVLNSDLYIAKATSQHEVSDVLEPERGKILIQDSNPSTNENSLYPLASNKKFALVYAVPDDLKDPQKVAESLYAVFNEEQVLKNVDSAIEKEDKDILDAKLADLDNLPQDEKQIATDKILKAEADLKASKDFQEVRQARITDEIKKMKDNIIGDYMKRLTRENDVYEPLAQKVDDDKLKIFFSKILSTDGNVVNPLDMELKDDLMFIKKADGEEEQIKFSGVDFIMKIYRYYPENNIGSNMTGFVSYAEPEPKGQYGLEGFFDEELTGTPGSIKTERSAAGELVIANGRQYNKPKNGSDLVLTINRSIQFEACEKLDAAVKKHGADSGSVIIMDPKTGGILAMCSYPDYDPNNYRDIEDIHTYNNPVIFDQYEPGSIFKAITMSAAIDQKKVSPETTYYDAGVVKIAKYSIKNSDLKSHGKVDMNTVLELSLNTGAIFAMRQTGADVFDQYVQNFGFGEKTGIELNGESAGDINSLVKEKTNKELYAATASFGQGIAVTPLQMVSAFAAIANGGVLMQPYLVKEIVHADGSTALTQPKQIRRVISERASMIMGGMLVNVVEKGHGKAAGVKGYYVAGKTGTAQVPKKGGGYEKNVNIGSFAGFAPANDPAFVMLVRMNHPRDVAWAESSAAPLFGDIAEYILNYFQIPTERPIK